MRYVSVCSGIEAATVAWHPLGWQPALFAEVDKFPSRVLAHHYPKVPNVGDFTKITKDQCGSVDLLAGGTPCQDFSVAGLRAGMDGERGQLTVEFAHLADRLRPRWLVWENVPGVLSIDGGGAFGTFLAMLGKFGYGFAYRILDAQHLGVPQRRRRIFVVGNLGDWRRAAAVLFERQSMSGDHPPCRETREGSARAIGDCVKDRGRSIAGAVSCKWSKGVGGPAGDECYNLITYALRADGFDASEDGTGRGTPLVPITAPTLNAGGNETGGNRFYGTTVDTADSLIPIAIQERAICENPDAGPDGAGFRDDGLAYTLEARTSPQAVAFQSSQSGVREVDAHATLDSNNGSRRHNGVVQGMAVRRLTPRECERLQGFPDDYTLIDSKTADGPRYKALGNSMAVPVMRWIGQRIAMVDAL